MRDYLNDRPIKLRRATTVAITSRRPFLIAIGVCLLAILLIWLDHAYLLGPVRGTLQSVLSPIAQPLTNMRDGVIEFIPGWNENQRLRDEVTALQEEISQLEAELLEYKQDRIENRYLRQQLDIEHTHPWKVLGAEVAIRTPDAGRRVIVIARGSSDGVEAGMAVIGQTGNGPAGMVGIVEAVGPGTADVLLINDFGSQISARVLNDLYPALGLVKGQWQQGAQLRLEALDRDTILNLGDPVISAGLTERLAPELATARIPANIPIGRVAAISYNEYATTAEVQPYVDLDRTHYVWVILNQDG